MDIVVDLCTEYVESMQKKFIWKSMNILQKKYLTKQLCVNIF